MQRGKAKTDRTAAEAAAAGRPPAALPVYAWPAVQLQLPQISWQGVTQPPEAARPPAAAATPGSPGPLPSAAAEAGAPRSCLSGLLCSAEAWARFQIDREPLMRQLEEHLAPLRAGVGGA